MCEELSPLQRFILDKIFDLQDKITRENAHQFNDRYSFISECIEILSNLNVSHDLWKTISSHQRIVFNYFHGDSVSTLISSLRLCLHGCDSDALSLMRIVIENLTIFDYIATKDLYEVALVDIKSRSSKLRPFSEKLSYETAIRELGIKDRRKKLWGQMSAVGAHASPSRLGLSRMKIDGIDYPRAGVAINNPRTKQVLGEIASIALFAVMVFDEFFTLTFDSQSPLNKHRQELEKKYALLQK